MIKIMIGSIRHQKFCFYHLPTRGRAVIKLRDAMFDEDDMFSPPRFDVQICYNDCMPPIYDDYNDESGFGEVMTLFSNDSTILEEVSIDYDENKVATYDDYCDDTYVIKSSDDYIYKIVMIMITPFLNITLLMLKLFIVFECRGN